MWKALEQVWYVATTCRFSLMSPFKTSQLAQTEAPEELGLRPHPIPRKKEPLARIPQGSSQIRTPRRVTPRGSSLIGARVDPCVLASHQTAPCLNISIVSLPLCLVPMGSPCPASPGQALSPLTLKQNPVFVYLQRHRVHRSLQGLSIPRDRFTEPGYT